MKLHRCLAITTFLVVLPSLCSGAWWSSSSSSEPSFTFDKGDDLRHYLAPELSSDPTKFQNVARHLREGKVVVIRNALDPALAEAVYKELTDEKTQFAVDQDYNAKGSHFHYHKLVDHKNSKILSSAMALFNNNDTKAWMSGLSERDCGGEATVRGEYFARDDYATPKTDYVYQRTVAFEWHLSKDWKPEFGGSFFWTQESQHHAYIHPSFNTLVLYSVSQDSSHMVTPVVGPAASDKTTTKKNYPKRLSLTGWWNSDWIPSATDNFEQILASDWRYNMTEFQLMAIKFVIHSESFESEKKEVLRSLLEDVEELHAQEYVSSWEYGSEIEEDEDEEPEEEDYVEEDEETNPEGEEL